MKVYVLLSWCEDAQLWQYWRLTTDAEDAEHYKYDPDTRVILEYL